MKVNNSSLILNRVKASIAYCGDPNYRQSVPKTM